MLRGEKWPRLAAIAGVILLSDQVTKSYIRQTMYLEESIPVIPNLFSLTSIRNPGAAFGLFAEQSPLFRAALFATVSVVVLVFLTLLFLQTPKEDVWNLTAIALLFGGAAGNTIDRLRFGEVVDFLDIYWRDFHWPAFNVADSAITIGITLMMIQTFRAGRPTPP